MDNIDDVNAEKNKLQSLSFDQKMQVEVKKGLLHFGQGERTVFERNHIIIVLIYCDIIYHMYAIIMSSIILALTLLVFVDCSFPAVNQHTQVFTLHPDQITEFTAHNKLFLLVIYNPEYPYSKAELIKLADQIHINNTHVKVARFNYKEQEVENTSIGSLIHMHTNSGPPSFFLMDQGYPIPIKGKDRSYNGIARWVSMYIQPQVYEIAETNLEDLPKPFYVFKTKDQEKIKTVMRVKYLHQALSMWVIIEQQGSTINDALSVYNKHGIRKYHGNFKIESLLLWVQNSHLPSITLIQTLHDLHKVVHQKKTSLIFEIEEHFGDSLDEQLLMIDHLCQKEANNILCGQLLPDNTLGHFLYTRLKIKRNTNFIAFFQDFTKIGYLYPQAVTQLSLYNLEVFVQKVRHKQIQPTFDFSIPDKIEYSQDIQLTKDQLEQEIKEHQYFFIKFYHQHQYTSKQAFKIFQKFSQWLLQQYTIESGAIDCHEYHEYCREKNMKDYPKYVLYIKGIPITFGENNQSPIFENLQEFIKDKLNSQIRVVKDIQQISEGNALIFEGAKINKQIEIMANSYHGLPVYFVEQHPQYFYYRMHLRLCNQTFSNPNRITDIDHEYLINWIKSRHDSKLQYLFMKELKEGSLTNFLLLVLSSSRENDIMKGITGIICEKLGIHCRVLAPSYQNYDRVAEFIGLGSEKGAQKLYYIDIDHKKIGRIELPRQNLELLNLEQVKKFIERESSQPLNQNKKLLIHQEISDDL